MKPTAVPEVSEDSAGDHKEMGERSSCSVKPGVLLPALST